MNKKYTKKQIQEAIKYWTKQLNEDVNTHMYTALTGPYLYVTKLNNGFSTPVRKIGASHGSMDNPENPETFSKKLKRYNTAVVENWLPAYLIVLGDDDASKIFSCEKELFNLLKQSRIGNKELFAVDDNEIQIAIDEFMKHHPTAQIYNF